MSETDAASEIKMPFPWKKEIRVISLGLLKNKEGKILVHLGDDPVKKEKFYRPLGGGVDYGETSEAAVIREFQEELGLKVRVKSPPRVFENIYTYYGRPGHEVVFIYEIEFEDERAYSRETFEIIENGEVSGIAAWVSREDVKREGDRLYPSGVLPFVWMGK